MKFALNLLIEEQTKNVLSFQVQGKCSKAIEDLQQRAHGSAGDGCVLDRTRPGSRRSSPPQTTLSTHVLVPADAA